MNKHEFIRAAADATDKYIHQDVPLFNSVLKFAMDNCLNAAQIFVLSNFTNTAAHSNAFQKMAATSAGDRYVEFDPVDPDLVIKAAGLSPRDGNDYSEGSPSVVGSSTKTASVHSGQQNAFVPGIVPDELRMMRLAEGGDPYANAKTASAEVFSADKSVREKNADDARRDLVRIRAKVEDEIRVCYAKYDMHLEKIASYLNQVPADELSATVGHLYNVDPERAEKIGKVLSDLGGTALRDYALTDVAPLLEKHANHVKQARWLLPLSPVPVRGNLLEALDSLESMAKLGEAYTYLGVKLK